MTCFSLFKNDVVAADINKYMNKYDVGRPCYGTVETEGRGLFKATDKISINGRPRVRYSK